MDYGRGNRHNCSWAVEGNVKNAQRAEVRAALGWALWAWCKQVYVADNDYTHKGVQAILEGRPKKFKSHRDLWYRMIRAIEVKGKENII